MKIVPAIKIESSRYRPQLGRGKSGIRQKVSLDLECTRTPTIHTVTLNALSIGELSRHSGLSTHTLRFYEAQGILQAAGRNASGHRYYPPGDVLWLEFVLRLKRTGMPLAEIRQYAALRAQGEATLEPRLAMLKLHREHLTRKIEELSICASALDEKIGTYQQMLAKPPAPRPRPPHDPAPKHP